MDMHQEKITVHVEIVQSSTSTIDKRVLKQEISSFLLKGENLTLEEVIHCSDLPNNVRSHVDSVRICKGSFTTSDKKHVASNKAELVCHVFQLESSEPDVEELQGGEEGEGSQVIPAATQWILPSTEFHNLWETLIYDTNIKDQLLNFVTSALLFSDRGVNSNIIAWNRVVLLHGPPGTGKTSLCKALAHKLSIRLSHRYSYGQLIEINSHSLFSKWFSESGKLVQQLFSRLHELVEDPEALVCVLIDEVESLARSRLSASAGTEPGDAVRVVNALLTQLDSIKRYPNVLILTTSNVSGTVDLAFIDRADIKFFVDLPSQSAIYQIYYSCIAELARVNLVTEYAPCRLLTLRQLEITNMVSNEATKLSLALWDIAKQSNGLSGRSLRKLPFLAHSLHMRGRVSCTLSDFLEALRQAVDTLKKDAAQVTNAR